jgi:cytidylate kinase
LHEPFDECFFCEPEPWRTIYSSTNVSVVAGAGPLCPGYVIVAPREHVHTSAELPETTFWEFHAVFEIVKRALRNQYGPGYTAYEHGRTGVCTVLEARGDLSTFCHHAHRILVPRTTHCADKVRIRFDSARTLDAPEAIRSVAGQPYIYYETSAPPAPVHREIFTGARDVPSQFMRRLVTNELAINRSWNWAEDHRVDEIADTTARLRGEFLGIDVTTEVPHRVPNGARTLQRNVSIDGLANVGKTALARLLGAFFCRPVLDTGLVFRHLAHSEVHGLAHPTPARLAELILSAESESALRTTQITEVAGKISREPEMRTLYAEIVRGMLPRLSPCIVVGRDAWRFLDESEHRFLVEADFETRLRRRLLYTATHHHHVPLIPDLELSLRRADVREANYLPTDDDRSIVRIANGRQPLGASFWTALSTIGA